MEIKFDRNSACMGDDIESHAVSFDINEEMSIEEFIKFLYKKPNVIAKISSGKATWILQLKNEDSYIDIAVFTEQMNYIKYFSKFQNQLTKIGEIAKVFNSTQFFAKYLGQKDPDEVYKNLQELIF